MKIDWTIEANDILQVKDFVYSQSNKLFVKNRIFKNIDGAAPNVTVETFWKAIISCLITTQQRSGPGSSVTRFICTDPFLLSFDKCRENKKALDKFVEKIITDFKGLRRAKKIGKEVDHNFKWLENDRWTEVNREINKLKECRNRNPHLSDRTIERNAAWVVSRNMKGFGPKQSRNLWQSLGLTRYEIPIDSRITKWLNQNKFPLKLSASALSDSNYYAFVMDGIQLLCAESNIY